MFTILPMFFEHILNKMNEIVGQINSCILELPLRQFRCLIFAPSQKS